MHSHQGVRTQWAAGKGKVNHVKKKHVDVINARTIEIKRDKSWTMYSAIVLCPSMCCAVHTDYVVVRKPSNSHMFLLLSPHRLRESRRGGSFRIIWKYCSAPFFEKKAATKVLIFNGFFKFYVTSKNKHAFVIQIRSCLLNF